MAVDNPSYFTLSGGAVPPSGVSEGSLGYHHHHHHHHHHQHGEPRGFAAFFRKRPIKMGTASSMGSSPATSTLPHCGSNRSITSVEESQPMLSRPLNGTNGPRRSFRSLFRSISANADNETLQILKGEPRPADVAPPSPYLPHRSHSHSDHDRRRPNRRRILKSASELLSNDMIFCGSPGENGNACRINDENDDEEKKMKKEDEEDKEEEEEEEEDETGEVFLSLDDARYYNLSATLPAPGASGSRRHSIGTFLDKEQSQSNDRRRIIQTEGFIKEPDTLAPPVPTDQVDGVTKNPHKSNRICRKHRNILRKGSRTRTGGGTASTKLDVTNASLMDDRDDVVFISSKDSEASTLWVNYLTACFEQISRQQGRSPFKVRHVTVEDSASTSPTIQDRICNARLQIIVVCPVLLERAATRSEQASGLARQLSPDRVLAMMLGVHDGHLSESQKNALITYAKWRKFFVKDQDETFVGEFLGAAVSILGTAPPAALRNDKTSFTVHPKKVKMGQNRVLVILNDPLRPEDMVSVVVDRCGEGIDISQVRRRNPYTLQFAIPDRCLEVSMLVGVRILVNGMPLGVRQVKCESRLRELDQILRAHDNPLEFMCQTFGFNSGDSEQLDTWMVHAFQRNLPPRFDLLSTPSGSAPLQRNTISPEEYPTLLHFAARFGLEKLCWQLLECPGGEIACDIKNVSELTPADLAEHSGHAKLAHQLRGYMQMSEFTNIYSYLKVISETSGSGANNDSASPMTHFNCLDSEHDKADYCCPRPLSEVYLVPPAARPITTTAPTNPTSPNLSEMNYSIVPPPTPVLGPGMVNLEASCLNLPLQGYLKMHPAGSKVNSSLVAPVTAPLLALKPSKSSQQSRKDLSLNREENTNSRMGSLSRSTSSQGAKFHEPSGPQDELLEIINDFKNNVFTISEVERLVDNWKNRNDVQQNFKDKQRQLTAMRDEYERIQKRMKDEMKAPTPFDRIKKFFLKGKKDTKESSAEENDAASTTSNKTDKPNGNIIDRRPISSLSLHSVSSSSSSGRMSIISGCSGTSLGDSGTHSDTEDRRHLRNSRDDKGGMMIYEIPPAPKPFTGRYSPMRYTPSPRPSVVAPEPDHRRPHPSNNSPNDNFYIAFPVSGLPIHSFNPDGTAIEPKPTNSSSETPESSTTSQIIPEEDCNSENPGKSGEEEINRLSIPSPPPFPPTDVPLEYANIVPANVPLDNSQDSVNNVPSCNNTPTSPSFDNTNISNDETVKVANEELPTIEDTTSENSQITRVQSNHVQDSSAGLDVVDAPRLPDYMNIQPGDQDPKILEMISKKTAPPVPPRAPTKK